MAMMTIDIPDGMTAHVILRTSDTFAHGEPLGMSYERVIPAAPPQHRSRWFLMSGGGVVLLVFGMILGGSLRSHNAANAETPLLTLPPLAQAAPLDPGPPPATTAFPLAPPAPPGALAVPSSASSGGDAAAVAPSPASDQVPPELAAELKAKPQVVPAPGQAGGPAQGQGAGSRQPQNPFGLGD